MPMLMLNFLFLEHVSITVWSITWKRSELVAGRTNRCETMQGIGVVVAAVTEG